METVCLGKMDYDGSQLKHAFAYEQKGVLGPSICFFTGAADVSTHLVDLEDSVNDDFIKSADMVHFIIEIPNIGIQEAVVWQRLFISMIASNLGGSGRFNIRVSGDDIFIFDRKLSVSIATVSLFGGLIHVGINIHVGEGCPVPAIGLADGVFAYPLPEWIEWARNIADMFVAEYDDIVRATYKVISR